MDDNINGSDELNNLAEEASDKVEEVVSEANNTVEEAKAEAIDSADKTVDALNEAVNEVADDSENAIKNAEAEVNSAIPTTETDSVNNGFSPVFENKPPKAAPQPANKSGVNLLLVGIIVLVAIIAVIFVCSGKTLRNSINKLTLDSDKYCQKVLTNDWKEKSDDITKNYKDALKTLDAKKTSYSSEAYISLSEDAIEDIGSEDIDFLADLKANIQVEQDENYAGIFASIGTAKKDVLSVNLIYVKEEQMAYCQIPELNEQYIRIDVEDLAGADVSSEEMSEVLKNLDNLDKLTPDEYQDFLDRYVEIIISHIEDVEEDKEEIEIDDLSQKVTSLTIEIDNDMLVSTVSDILDALAEDETLEKYADSYSEALDLDEDLWDALNEAIEEVSDELDDASEDLGDLGTLVLYVNSKGEISGLEFEAISHKYDYYSDAIAEVKENFRFITIQKGTKYGIDIGFESNGDELFSISGIGKKSFDKISGTFEFSVEGESIEFSLDKCKFSGKEISGTISINIADFIEVADADDLKDFEDYTLFLEFKFTTKKSFISLKLADDEDVFLEAHFDLSESSFKKIKVPKDKNCVDIEDEDDFCEWYEDSNIDDVNEALEEIGFPKDILPDEIN